MKRLKQAIFFLTVVALFAIVGGMDQDFYSPEIGAALAGVDFVVMAWSGFGSGLLQLPKGKQVRK